MVFFLYSLEVWGEQCWQESWGNVQKQQKAFVIHMLEQQSERTTPARHLGKKVPRHHSIGYIDALHIQEFNNTTSKEICALPIWYPVCCLKVTLVESRWADGQLAVMLSNFSRTTFLHPPPPPIRRGNNAERCTLVVNFQAFCGAKFDCLKPESLKV